MILEKEKIQKTCGSCWVFAATAVIEYWEQRLGNQANLSEQNLVDCVQDGYGCDGGWPTSAYQYIRDQGVSDGRKYVYENRNQTCQRKLPSRYPPILKIPNACELYLNGDEERLRKLIAQYGPVTG